MTQGARPKPSRKTKSKGNHLKNLHNRIEIKNEYEQNHVPLISASLNSHQQLTSELGKKLEKSCKKLEKVRKKFPFQFWW